MDSLEMLTRWLEPDEKILYYSDGTGLVAVNKWGKAKLGGGPGARAAFTDRRFYTCLKGSLFGKDVTLEHEVVYNPDYAEYRIKNRLSYYYAKLPEGKTIRDFQISPSREHSPTHNVQLLVRNQVVAHRMALGLQKMDTVGVSAVNFSLRHHPRPGEKGYKRQDMTLKIISMGTEDLEKVHNTQWYSLYEMDFHGKPVYKLKDSAWERVQDNAAEMSGFLQKTVSGLTQERVDELWEMAYNI
jgi:hypothetical protein